MARYSRRRVATRRRRRAPVSRSYKQIGLDYLKKIGRAIAYGTAAAAVGGGAAAAYKYRNRFRPAAAAAGERIMAGYDVAEGYAGGAYDAASNVARDRYNQGRARWEAFRAVPNYGAQFREAVQMQHPGVLPRVSDNLSASQYRILQANRALRDRVNAGYVRRN